MEHLVVYCADVGSIKEGNFGWARAEAPRGDVEQHCGGTEILDLVQAVADDLAAELPVALGFECPLFVPVPQDPSRLGAARSGDGARAWSAGAGTAVLTTGLVQAAWVLVALRLLRADDEVHLDWAQFEASGRGLFLWEAFVTADAKGVTHVDDARAAVRCFRMALPDPQIANAVTAERPLSLIGAVALWAGWSTDLRLLNAPILALKATVGG